MPEHKPKVHDTHDPPWLRRFKKGGFYAVAVFVGAFLVAAGMFIESAGRVIDRFRTPDAFVLAENTAKSSFSDQFAQRAWRRMFWARNFRARVLTKAPIADVDTSWSSYIDAVADWNTNLMISIVGLQNYYGRKRSEEFEYGIQELFKKLDDRMGELRRSDVVRGLRNGVEATPDQLDGLEKGVAKEIKSDLEEIDNRLYVLVRCVSEKDKTKNLCPADDELPRNSWTDFWQRLFSGGAG